MAMFTGFKPSGMEKIANRLGYKGNMMNFDSYLEQNPDKKRQMLVFEDAARKMAAGGYVKMQEGGLNLGPQVVVYGPDGTSYGNPQIAERAGVTDYTMTQPAVNQPPLDPTVGIPKQPDPRDIIENLPPELINPQPPGIPITPPIYQPGPPPELINPQPPVEPPVDAPDLSQTPREQSYVPTLGTGEGQVDAYGDKTIPVLDEEGNPVLDDEGNPVVTTRPATIQDVSTTKAQTGALPEGAVTTAELTPLEQQQLIDTSLGAGEANTVSTTAQAGTQQAPTTPTVKTYRTVTADESKTSIDEAIAANTAKTMEMSDESKVIAAQTTKSSVGDLDAAQGNAILIDNAVQREIQDGELIEGVANAEKAAKFTEQIEAATATPSEKATVQGQLAQLTENFDATNPPAWAAGAIRGVQAAMQRRGIGASSMAGQALIQAAMESALPIAQADAGTVRTFELQNLSNRQSRAMLAAEQRAKFMGQEFTQEFQARVQNAATISDIANRNFTAEQQIQLENSKIANTMNLQNLSNSQALVMAEASALAQLDTANLSNRQQAAVENAKSFLAVDMANLSNEQQTAMLNMQSLTQSIFNDQAATNAANQFNATSQTQVDQFFANLKTQVEQFNATQANAQAQFNAGEQNTLARFNAEVMNARDQFNATNQIAIAQNNAVWRRELATADTAAINRANELNAKAVLDISNEAYNDLWAFFADTMEWAWKSAENEQDRINALGVANISKDAQKYTAEQTKKASGSTALGNMISVLGSAIIGA